MFNESDWYVSSDFGETWEPTSKGKVRRQFRVSLDGLMDGKTYPGKDDKLYRFIPNDHRTRVGNYAGRVIDAEWARRRKSPWRVSKDGGKTWLHTRKTKVELAFTREETNAMVPGKIYESERNGALYRIEAGESD